MVSTAPEQVTKIIGDRDTQTIYVSARVSANKHLYLHRLA
jgi:hypothetical protein